MNCSRQGEPVEILLIEDNEGDIDLVTDAMSRFTVPHRLQVAHDGEQALAALLGPRANHATLPQLILLDLNIPKIDGREVLASIKADERTRHIPVIVLTSSGAERDLLNAYRLYANCFITKPTEVESFFAMFELIERFWLMLVKLPPSHPQATNQAMP